MLYSRNEPLHTFSHINTISVSHHTCIHNHKCKWCMQAWASITYVDTITEINSNKEVDAFWSHFSVAQRCRECNNIGCPTPPPFLSHLSMLSPSNLDVLFLSCPQHLILQNHPGLSSWQGASFMRILQLADKRPCQTPFIALAWIWKVF